MDSSAKNSYQAISDFPSSDFHKQDLIFSKIIKWIQKNYEILINTLTLVLGSINYISSTWNQNTYPAISPESSLQFSQVEAHFLQDYKMNPITLWNFKKLQDLRGAQKLHLGHLGQKDVSSYKSRIQDPIFTSRMLFSPTSQNKSTISLNFKKIFSFGVWGLETTFGSFGIRTFHFL